MPEINIHDQVKCGISIKCLLCDSCRELTNGEYQYNRRFGTTAGIYICEECKKAIGFAKWFLQKHPIRLSDQNGFIHEVMYINTRNDNGKFD